MCQTKNLPNTLKYGDVVRRTKTTLDVLAESRIDDYWNVDGGREPSGRVNRGCTMGGRKQPGKVCSFIASKDGCYPCTWIALKWQERHKHWSRFWKTLMNRVDLEKPTTFLDQVYLGCTQRQCKQNNSHVDGKVIA